MEQRVLTNGRNCNVDFIRVIACIAVVGLHTFSKDLSIITSSLYYLCGFAVPVFFMSSGYFLLNRGEVGYKYVIKKFIGIIRIVLFWNLIIFILKFTKQLIFNDEVTITVIWLVKNFIKSFLQKGTLWQFWYFGATLIIYALLPILSKMKSRTIIILLFCCGIMSIAIEISSFLCGMPLQKTIIQTFRVWTWLFYFLLGAEMPKIKVWCSAHLNLIIHFVMLVIATILIITYQNFVGSKIILETTGALHAEYFYDSFFEMYWIILMYSFLLRIDFSDQFTNYLFKLSPLTLGIYIIHPLVRKVILVIVGDTTVVKCILYWLITLLITTIVTWIIRKIPFGKYLVKI